MKKKKAQDLSTAEREQIAQEFMFKINQAAEDDEEAVQNGRPALNKLKMLKVGSYVTLRCWSSSAPTEGLYERYWSIQGCSFILAWDLGISSQADLHISWRE